MLNIRKNGILKNLQMAAKSVSKSACKPYTLTRTYDLQVCRSRERAMLPLLLNKSLADFSPFIFWLPRCFVDLQIADRQNVDGQIADIETQASQINLT
jgi:hypothetical protein